MGATTSDNKSQACEIAESGCCPPRSLPVWGAVLLVVIAVRSFLRESLWLDETITAWIVRDGWREVIERATTFQGQSPLYYLVVWATTRLTGLSEIALRAPSVVCLAASAWVFFRLLARRFEPAVCWAATAFFISFTQVLLCLSARPYALALLCAVCSFFFWSGWRATRSNGQLVGYVIFSALMVLTHFLFGLVFAVQGIVMLIERERALIPRWCAALSAIALLSFPGWLQLLSLFERREALFFRETVEFSRFAMALLPPPMVVSVVMVAVLTALLHPAARVSLRTAPFSLWSYAALIVFAPAVFYLYSALGSGALFKERYFCWSAIGYTLLIAATLSGVTPSAARYRAALLLVVVLLAAEANRTWQIERWREAHALASSAVEDSPGTILYASGLTESMDVSWYEDPQRGEYLRAPLSYYPLTGGVAPVLIPPAFGNQHAREYLDGALRTAFDGRRSVVLVTLVSIDREVRDAIKSAATRYERTALQTGGVSVYRYTPAQPPAR